MDKKTVFFGIYGKYRIGPTMEDAIEQLSSRGISYIKKNVHYAGFETPHVHVRFVCSGDDHDDLRGLRADAVFGCLWDIMIERMNPGADNWRKLDINLIDYICMVEREAYRHTTDMCVCDMYPPTMFITMPPRNGKTLYGESPTAQLELYDALMKGENNMATSGSIQIQRGSEGVVSLAKAFKELGNAFNRKLPGIKNVHFSGPVTAVIWEDGTKTIVRRAPGEAMDPEKGLAMAIAKKALGTNKSGSNYYDIFKQWLQKPEVEEEKKDG